MAVDYNFGTISFDDKLTARLHIGTYNIGRVPNLLPALKIYSLRYVCTL